MNHYAGQMYLDHGGRHYNFAKYLNHYDYKPVIFCANQKMNPTNEQCIETNDLWIENNAEEIDVPFVFVRVRKYLGNGMQRVLNMCDYYRNVKRTAIQYSEMHGKPDVIMASSVHPLTMIAGIQLAQRFRVKCICEVRDLWPEAIVTYSNKIMKNSMLARICISEIFAFSSGS